MSLDSNKFKNLKQKEEEKLAIVVVICIFLAIFFGPLPILYLFYYIFKKAIVLNNKNDSMDIKKEQKDNLYEELQDVNTKDYYKYDVNDISQKEIHEHREDFWNANSPIKYK